MGTSQPPFLGIVIHISGDFKKPSFLNGFFAVQSNKTYQQTVQPQKVMKQNHDTLDSR